MLSIFSAVLPLFAAAATTRMQPRNATHLNPRQATGPRQFTVTNKCSYTVWPAMFTDLNVGSSVPNHPVGWEAPPGDSQSFEVPGDWAAGRIWGIPPVTVAEWTLGRIGGEPDNYDVSLVDGFSIPISIVPTGGCAVAACAKDLNPECPAELQFPSADGTIAGCKSACTANLDGNPQDSPNCCSGSHNLPSTCPASGVQYYDYFKGGCPTSYAFAYDEPSGTALWKCDASLEVGYTVTFCPDGDDGSTSASASASASGGASASASAGGSMSASGAGGVPTGSMSGGVSMSMPSGSGSASGAVPMPSGSASGSVPGGSASASAPAHTCLCGA
ncbi:Thaumatin-like protein [Mycena kentingensis (nom. inval.)]|nr:Thaumatin-like protein [Mycena kentingensis (nom. inval.)]